MNMKLFQRLVKYIDKEIPNTILISLITLLTATTAYICGQLFIMNYFFEDNFTFLDIIINPLPIKYGHILFIGSFLLIGCIGLTAVLIIISIMLKNRDSRLLPMIVLFIFLNYGIVYVFTNGNHLINTAIFCIYISIIVIIIGLFIHILTNYQFSLLAFVIWFTLVVAITIFNLNHTYSSIEILQEILTIPFLGFFIMYILLRYTVGLIGKPRVKTLKDIYKEANSVFKSLSLKLKGVITSVVSIGLVSLAFSIVISLVPLINNLGFSDESYDQISINGNTPVKGIYIGAKEGTHFYINEDNMLIQTSSEIHVSPIESD
ncbi:hypothetical protein [Oceanobacillus jeddahense]|uniref:DUF998 domain-containing protein n=1 Tax=Oceanobacillus jeddahense TaxID=1462527 RepID=A0ABY5JTB7_9BACI|nr:hypothetical protein [Oceanobacillus jeddahense]UUI02423.1 hypothetical protein NP439_20660 [Oceanobacillus jeddahense]